MRHNNGRNSDLDLEWVLLMAEAKEYGFEPEEIREFLLQNQPHHSIKKHNKRR